jgi:hypothetical protein
MKSMFLQRNLTTASLSKLKSGVKPILVLFLVSFIALPLWAQNSDSQSSSGEALVVAPYEASSDQAQTDSEELEIVVHDENSVTDNFINDANAKTELLGRLNRSLGTSTLTPAGIEMPWAPAKSEDLVQVEQMTSGQIANFLNKKEKILNKMVSMMLKIKLKKTLINKILVEFNRRFYKSARVIEAQNTAVGGISFNLSAGLALPEKYLNKLKAETKLGKFIPSSGGFYLVLATGMSFSRTVKNGKNRYSWEIFLDAEKLNKTFTGVVQLAAFVAGGGGVELREGKFQSQEMESSYAGPIGSFRQGKNHFGWTFSTGLSVPPGSGTVIFAQNQTYRYYLLRVSRDGISIPVFGALSGFVRDLLSPRGGIVLTCSGLFTP